MLLADERHHRISQGEVLCVVCGSVRVSLGSMPRVQRGKVGTRASVVLRPLTVSLLFCAVRALCRRRLDSTYGGPFWRRCVARHQRRTNIRRVVGAVTNNRRRDRHRGAACRGVTPHLLLTSLLLPLPLSRGIEIRWRVRERQQHLRPELRSLPTSSRGAVAVSLPSLHLCLNRSPDLGYCRRTATSLAKSSWCFRGPLRR